MYRHSAPATAVKAPLPSPAPDDLGDSEAELVTQLDRKWRLLDSQIERFKAQKRREFHDFEVELRSKRKLGRSKANASTPPAPGTDPDHSRPSRYSEADILSLKPTVSVSALTVNGTTTPPLSGLSTSPLALSRQLSRSPIPQNLAATPPRSRTSSHKTLPDYNSDFPGLFTPTFLPLLDSHLPSSDTASPAPPADGVASPLTKRAHTAPSAASRPSALRTASGPTVWHKRKQVMFQLRDEMIVEPSSSYEETSSPYSDEEDGYKDVVDTRTPYGAGPMPMDRLRSPPNRNGSPMGRHRSRPSDTVADVGVATGGFFELDEELEDLEARHAEYHEVSWSIACSSLSFPLLSLSYVRFSELKFCTDGEALPNTRTHQTQDRPLGHRHPRNRKEPSNSPPPPPPMTTMRVTKEMPSK